MTRFQHSVIILQQIWSYIFHILFSSCLQGPVSFDDADRVGITAFYQMQCNEGHHGVLSNGKCNKDI